MLARVSIISTEQKRAGVQVYNGPKAVRDHGRVATRNSGGAADKGTTQTRAIDLAHNAIAEAQYQTVEEAFLPIGVVDSGFDVPVPNFPKDSDGFDSRAADEAPPLLSRPKVFITATLADGLVVSSAPRELTP